MVLLNNTPEVLGQHSDIDGGGRQVGVAEQKLDGAKVCASHVQVGGEGVTQGVRTQGSGNPGFLCTAVKYVSQGTLAEGARGGFGLFANRKKHAVCWSSP